MSTTATYAPITSAIPAPSRPTDVFDFLQVPDPSVTPENEITIEESSRLGLVEVTMVRPDGRSLSRTVPTPNWKNSDYREGVIRSMSMILA